MRFFLISLTALLLSLPASAQDLAKPGVDALDEPAPRILDVRLADSLVAARLVRGEVFEGVLDATAGDDVPIPVRGRVLDVVVDEGDYDHLTLTLSEVYYGGQWQPLATETLRLQRERKTGSGWLGPALSLGAALGDGFGGRGCRRTSAIETGARASLAGLALLLSDRSRLELAEGDVLSFVVAEQR